MFLEIKAPVKIRTQPANERGAVDDVRSTVRRRDSDRGVLCEVRLLLSQVKKLALRKFELQPWGVGAQTVESIRKEAERSVKKDQEWRESQAGEK